MSIGGSNTGEPSGGRHACAACRHQRKRCEEDCVMAPYFTADKEEEFKAVHKLFGVSNMSKLLKQLEYQNHRALAVQSFIWEAYMWKQDPIGGPFGRYKALEEECEYLRSQLNSNRPESESMGVVDQGSTKAEAEGRGAPNIYSSGLNYGFANQTLGLGHGCTSSFTSLLQGQDTESSKAFADCVSVASTYPMPMSQVRGFQDQRKIGMESFNLFHQLPAFQGVNFHDYRPIQVQGRRGRGTEGMMIDCARTCNGLVVYEPQTGQEQKREIGATEPQVSPILSGHRRSTSQRFSPYEQHNPIQVPRQAMRQQDQNQQNFPAQHQWNTSGQSCDNFQDAEHINEVKSEKP